MKSLRLSEGPGQALSGPANLIVIILWCCICFYPAAWFIFQDEAQLDRMDKWTGYTLKNDDKTVPITDLIHRATFPTHNAIIKGKYHKIDWENLTASQAERIDHYGYSCLGYAAMMSDKKMVAALLKKNPNVNQGQASLNTPLMIATMEKNREVIALLQSVGAKSDLHNLEGLTALHLAAQIGITELISGSDPKTTNFDVKNNRGQTPLDLAVMKKRLNIIMELAIAGAEPETSVAIEKPIIAAYLALCRKTGDPVGSARVIAEKDSNSDFQKLVSPYDYPAEFPVDAPTPTQANKGKKP